MVSSAPLKPFPQLVLDPHLPKTKDILRLNLLPVRERLAPAELQRVLGAIIDAIQLGGGLVGNFGICRAVAGDFLKDANDIGHGQVVRHAYRDLAVLAKGLLLGVEQALNYNTKVVINITNNGEKKRRLTRLGAQVTPISIRLEEQDHLLGCCREIPNTRKSL